MADVGRLARAAHDGLAFTQAQPAVIEAEVFVADNRSLLTRLNYTSHIPCNGVEEPKSIESYGLSVRAVFTHLKEQRIGMGSEPGNLSLDGVKAALEKARRTSVHDPDFRMLPGPSAEKRTLMKYHDPLSMELKDDHLVHAG